ncbi:MFS transporter [Rhodococcus sp. NPDC058514]|uniref:MFS transporter n=1 Tax=unclassified Rhodococcus (in: high G+C Gram-positive bacteria) TaxID=192944 RepID=UPI003657024B
MTLALPRLSRSTVTGYSLGSVGTGGFATLPGLVLAYYLTDTLGVAAAAASVVVFAPKALDVVINPYIGARSDADAARTGTRRRFLLLGALALPVFFALTFAVPAGASTLVGCLWVTAAFILAAIAFSLFQVPYIALPAELTDDYHERSRLMSWRVALLAVAILLFGAGGPALRDLGGGGGTGYLLMGVVAGSALGLGMLAAWRIAPRGDGVEHGPVAATSGHGLADSLAAVRSSGAFRFLLGTFTLQALATGCMLGAAQYVATYVLDSEGAVSILFAALVAPALAVMPMWIRLVRVWGKQRAYFLASGLFLASAVALLGLLAAPGPWVYAVVALAGIGYAGMQMLPMSMLPDVISDHEDAAAGSVRAGAFSGVWTAAETVGMALGPAVVLAILAVTGFVSSTGEHTVTQSDGSIAGIVIAFAAVPAVLVAASMIALRGYSLAAEERNRSNQ